MDPRRKARHAAGERGDLKSWRRGEFYEEFGVFRSTMVAEGDFQMCEHTMVPVHRSSQVQPGRVPLRKYLGGGGCRVRVAKRTKFTFGNEKSTIQSVTIVGLNEEKNYLLVNGSVPGNKGNIVKVQKAVKVNQ